MAHRQGFQQQQQQTQVQIASSVQVLLSSIMEMPLADFEERLQNELLDNEALEVSEIEENEWNETPDVGNEQESPTNALTDALGDYRTLDDVPENLREAYNRMGDDNRQERQIADDETSYENLYRQIGELPINEHETAILTYLVGSLDENGFLTKDNATLCDELAFQEYIDTTPEEVERIAMLLQTFEPRGIGARDLRQCLLLQLPSTGWTRQVVDEYFDDLMHSRWHKIRERLDVDEETIDEIRHEIARLNPRPGSMLSETTRSTAPGIVPDFRVYIDENGIPVVAQHRGRIPELRVSPSFAETIVMHRRAQDKAAEKGEKAALSREQEEAFVYARQKVEAAQSFIESIRRRHYTLQRVMEAIVERQRDFFLGDDDDALLHPMVLKDIAEMAGVDISTVSRAVNSKYVETDFGTYPLRYFFSTQFVAADGETIAARKVKAAIAEMVAAEDRRAPLSDETLAAMLAERGMKVARRTVSKYREQLGIPKSGLRR